MGSLMCYCLFVFLVSTAQAAKVQPCPLDGPDYLAPRFPSSSSYIKRANSHIARAIETATQKGTSDFGNVDASATSFSIGVYSLHEQKPLYTFNYDGPKLPEPKTGVSKVDSNTIYRIGSISKLLSVYLYLATIGDESFHVPITRYIPEFAKYAAQHPHGGDTNLDVWDFDSITVGSLASQLSGLPLGTIGILYADRVLEQLPSPKIPKIPANITGANCPDSYDTPCERATFLENIMLQKPVAPPFYRPVYSNVAFGVMGLALEKITGQAMPDLFKERLVKPLHLNATYYAAPPTPDNGIIPFNDSISFWTADLGNQSAAANFYSSINDMERLGRSILNSTLLSEALTRRFLKPAAFADRVRSAIGYSWEIYGTKRSVGKLSWIYSKKGDIGAYSTITALLPDWDIGFNVFAAGAAAAEIAQPLADTIVEHIVPAIEKAAKEEARRMMTGTYRDAKTNSTMVLEVDEGPGIAITSWTAEGTNMLDVWATFLSAPESSLRMYPSGLRTSDRNTIGYRIVAYNPDAEPDSGTLSLACFEWVRQDEIPYGRYGLDELSVTVDPRTRRAVSVEPRAFGVALPRLHTC